MAYVPYVRVALAAAVTLILLAVVALVVSRTREGFSIGNIFKKAVGGIKKGFDTVKNGAVGVVNNVTGKDPAYTPTFVGRQWDGVDWACPAGTVDTGREDFHACLASPWMYPLWRWDGKKWGWSCPAGTVETGEGQWEKKCLGGWIGRVNMNNAWKCPVGTADAGANWNNSSYHEALKQCKLNGAYTTRDWNGKAWACPPGTKDTGRNWGMTGGEKQCKFVAG